MLFILLCTNSVEVFARFFRKVSMAQNRKFFETVSLEGRRIYTVHNLPGASATPISFSLLVTVNG